MSLQMRILAMNGNLNNLMSSVFTEINAHIKAKIARNLPV